MKISEYGYVLIKLYSKKQLVGQIQPAGCVSLPVANLDQHVSVAMKKLSQK
jgi:hypothetical protein